jgi:uncharacterized protein DUF3987
VSFTPVFFDTLFPTGDSQGTDLGYVTISCYPGGSYNPKAGPTQHHSFAWPSQREQLITWCLSNEKLDLFTTPCLFTAPSAVEEKYIGRRWAVSASTGLMALPKLLAEPTIVVATAPGEHDVYWVTDHSYAPDAEKTSQALAYAHVADGCLTDSYASLTQMRVPGSANSSRGSEVEIVRFGLPMTRDSLRSAYPDLSDEEAGVPLEPMPESWWCTTASTLESRAVRKVSRPVEALYGSRDTDRTQASLDRLLAYLSQHGVSKPTALHMAWESTCNPHRDPASKWGGDTDGEMLTWRDVLRVYADPANAAIPRMRERVTSMLSVTGGSPEISRPEFISDDEAMRIGPDSFISRYERWAATQTDAPHIYHRLNAAMILSAIFGEFGACPNGDRLTLWGMVLGPTTWARKTTAMNLFKDLLASTHERKFPGYYIASDFTKEALSVSLAERTGQSSLVARDEADGMFEEVFKSPAKSGTLEVLTDLFNGRVPKRIRVGDGSAGEAGDGESIEEATTNFVLYACATTDRMTRVLTEDLIKSGFLTRFLYAVADPGEPVEGSLYLDLTGDDEDDLFGDPERDKLVRELCAARSFWHNERNLEPGAFKKIRFTPEANVRWNVFQDYVIRYCPDPSMKELIRPIAARLAFAVMRLSVLFAMVEQQVKVDIDHVLRAIQYSEEWFQSAYTVATRITGNAGYDAQERILATIKELSERGGVLTESDVFRRFRRNMEYPDFKKHLKALETASIVHTAMDPKKRDTVRITYLGK